MSPDYLAPDFRILLDGAPLSADAAKSVMNVSVVSEPDTLDQLTLTVANPLPEMRWTHGTDAGFFREGQRVTVELGYVGRTRPMFKGVLTSIAPSFPEAGAPTLTVTGHTRMHALRGATKTRTFTGMTDAEIAAQIGGDAGLGVDADPNGVKYDYVIQYNETDLAFLMRRARRIGFELTVEGDRLRFGRARASEQPTYTLVWRHPQRAFAPGARALLLRTFSLATNTLGQVTEVIVRGQDPKSGEAIEGRAGSGAEETRMGSTTGADVAAGALGREGDLQPAAARLRGRERLHDRAARAPGGPGGRPGRARRPLQRALLREAGDALDLRRGLFDLVRRGEERGPMTRLLDLLEGDSRQPDRIYGVVTAVVTNNKDPDKLGRVKLRFPWLSERDESWWARVATPMAGHERGVFFLPEVDDHVLVAFEHGDVRVPFVVGALWSGGEATRNKPPTTNEDGRNNVRVIKSRSGHVIRLDDTDRAEKIEIVDKTEKSSIVIDAVAKTIAISGIGDVDPKTGEPKKSSIVIDAAANTVAISAHAGITITSSSGKLRLEGDGVEIESRAGVTVHASEALDLTADGETTVKGAVVNIN
jgi:uncharacterized protein